MENYSAEDVRKCRRLLKRCDGLEENNERLLCRLHGSKNLMLRCKRDIGLLTAKLVAHENSLTAIPVDEPVSVTEHIPVIKPQASTKQSDEQNAGELKQSTKRKSEADGPENDPNAPKKPCNAFFEFCQEQQPLVFAETNSENAIEPSKQEVLKQLAQRWSSLTNEEKQVYEEMFVRSKEKYAVQMSQYKNLKKENEPQQQ